MSVLDGWLLLFPATGWISGVGRTTEAGGDREPMMIIWLDRSGASSDAVRSAVPGDHFLGRGHGSTGPLRNTSNVSRTSAELANLGDTTGRFCAVVSLALRRPDQGGHLALTFAGAIRVFSVPWPTPPLGERSVSSVCMRSAAGTSSMPMLIGGWAVSLRRVPGCWRAVRRL